MEFSDRVVERVRLHESLRAEVGKLLDANSGKVSRLKEIIFDHPEQYQRFNEASRHQEALIREMEISVHKAKAILDQLNSEHPDEAAIARGLDQAIVVVKRMKEDASKYNAILDEILAACGQKS